MLNIPHLVFQNKKSYALLGENGSGKSTLLRIIAGILPADTGQVIWGDLRMSFAYIPQKPYSFHLPVWKSVTLGLDALSRKQRRAVSTSALGELGVSSLADKLESNLSGGEYQRVALARVMMRKKQLLLLDEPTSAVDFEGCALAEATLKKYQNENGCTIIFATHSVEQARRFADDAIVFESGKIIASGPIEQAVREYFTIMRAGWRQGERKLTGCHPASP